MSARSEGRPPRSADETVRRMEEISIDAWPALKTLLFDGWAIRFADGFSRRSNSVVPLHPSEKDPLEKIRLCESLYRSRGLPCLFKLTAASLPEELDGLLAGEGYRREAESGVQVLARKTDDGPPVEEVILRAELADEWLAALCRMNAYDPRHHATVRALTKRIGPPRMFAAMMREGRIIGCGLGVVRQGYAVLFDIVVDERFRRQGAGRRIVESLLRWGGKQSAGTAFLQVLAENSPALALYAGLGFREEYRYWYRVKE
jgi:ribosomal protein S18 acetylase RimI-like enzyme